MTVYLVIVNGAPQALFDTLPAAEHHAKQMNRKWSTTRILQMEVQLGVI